MLNLQSPSSLTDLKPVLKWAGGKTQLLPQLNELLPDKLKTGKVKKYIEPFIGGGAMFFYLYKKYHFSQIYLFDINKELIILYNSIKNNVEEIIHSLSAISDEYLTLNNEKRKEYYYQKREEYNNFDKNIDANKYSLDFIPRAALTIFLNRTCFNGLYRVNSQNKFNVPVGKYKNPTILDEKNLRSVSQSLQTAEIRCCDFDETLNYADADSFIYYDPPYRPISQTSDFNSYTLNNFDDNEQKRLKLLFEKCHKKGALQMESNSDPTNFALDAFFDDLYVDFNIYRINANRIINSNAQKRGIIKELVITNY
jgi:DNA adenine methylase